MNLENKIEAQRKRMEQEKNKLDMLMKKAKIRQREKTFSVIYRVKDDDGTEHQRSETFPTQKDADRRLKEIEYKKAVGKFVVPKCTVVKELNEEYVRIYGHDKWGMENAFYNKENLNSKMKEDKGDSKKIEVSDGVDAELLMKVLANPEMASLLTSLAKTMKV